MSSKFLWTMGHTFLGLTTIIFWAGYLYFGLIQKDLWCQLQAEHPSDLHCENFSLAPQPDPQDGLA